MLLQLFDHKHGAVYFLFSNVLYWYETYLICIFLHASVYTSLLVSKIIETSKSFTMRRFTIIPFKKSSLSLALHLLGTILFEEVVRMHLIIIVGAFNGYYCTLIVVFSKH